MIRNILARAEPGYTMGLVLLSQCCLEGDRMWHGGSGVPRWHRVTAMAQCWCWCGSSPIQGWVTAWPWLSVDPDVIPCHPSAWTPFPCRSLQASWHSFLSPHAGPAFAPSLQCLDPSHAIPNTPGHLLALLRGCCTRHGCPIPSVGSGLSHQPPCDHKRPSGSFSASAWPATPPARALSSAINAQQVFLDGLLVSSTL